MTANKTPHPNLPWKAPGEASEPKKGSTALSHNLSLVGHSPESPFDAIRQTDEDGREFDPVSGHWVRDESPLALAAGALSVLALVFAALYLAAALG